MSALFHTAPGTPLAACSGFKPEDWLRLVWKAGAGATTEMLGKALHLGAEVVKGVLSHGPVAGVVEAARAAGSEDGLRDKLRRVARAVVWDFMEERKKAISAALWIHVTNEVRGLDPIEVLLDKLLASLRRKRRAPETAPRPPRDPAAPDTRPRLTMEQQQAVWINQAAYRGERQLRRLVVQEYLIRCQAEAPDAETAITPVPSHAVPDDAVTTVCDGLSLDPARPADVPPAAEVQQPAAKPEAKPESVVPKRKPARPKKPRFVPKSPAPKLASNAAKPKSQRCLPPAEITRTTGLPIEVARMLHREITAGRMPLMVLDEVVRRFHAEVIAHGRAPP